MSCILCIFMTIYLRRENKRRDTHHKSPETYTREDKLKEQNDGDNASFFRYTT